MNENREYILQGVNINTNMSTINMCICIEHGIDQLENILTKINLSNKEDAKYFKENLNILKRWYEKLDRDIFNNTPHISNIVITSWLNQEFSHQNQNQQKKQPRSFKDLFNHH